MFKEKTVFVLGAGASYYYGYPLGTELITDIIKNTSDYVFLPITENGSLTLESLKPDLRQILYLPSKPAPSDTSSGCPSDFTERQLFEIKEIAELKTALEQFIPLSIDTFLRDHERLQAAGKLMIIYSLLKNEHQKSFTHEWPGISEQTAKPRDIRDNWYPSIFNELVSGCGDNPEALLENQVSILTFNYDLSLDYYIRKRLRATEFFTGVADQFINAQLDISHVYGSLYDAEKVTEQYGEYQKFHTADEYCNMTRLFYAYDQHLNNKNGIKVICEQREKIAEHEAKLREAKRIIFIGFGFDRDNLDTIGFPKTLKEYSSFFADQTTLYYLNYNGSMTSLDKEFEKVGQSSRAAIIRSGAKFISHAYQNDFRKQLFD